MWRAVRVALFALLIAPAPAPADGGDSPWRWTRRDVSLQLSYTALHVVDWGQTLDLARRAEAENWIETNPILGRHPSEAKVHAYMLVTLAANLGIAAALPRPYRTAWQVFAIGWDGSTVVRNWRMGIRVSF